MDDTPSRDIAEPAVALASAVEPLRWMLDDVPIGVFSTTAGRFIVTTRAFRDALGSQDPETLVSVHASELDARTEDIAVVQADGRRRCAFAPSRSAIPTPRATWSSRSRT
jgi:hypothetical protein